ncbi:MAG: hypothetical protein KBF28_11145 [Gemmatimonadales bacterium]|nr:hypothetical protein [Gemmatimonadales bacterium]
MMQPSNWGDLTAPDPTELPLLGPEADPDYLTLTGLLLLVLSFAALVALALPL